MTDKKLTRRAMLQGTAAAGAGILAAGSGFPVFGQDAPKPDAPLPVGASGKLIMADRLFTNFNSD